ncbi:MAG: iron-containing alcohol dehydrogenase, partial [Paracoccaceae bacterium]
VVYDVDLTLTLPVALTVTSALNAIAHAMEALYAPDRNPVIEAMVGEALPAFRDALPMLIHKPQDQTARSDALYAAWCCSTALGYVSMALHHKLAHVLGGSFGLPHAETHAVLLPHTTAYNEPAVDGLLQPIADTFGHGTAGKGLWHFAKSVSAPMRLADLGLTAQDLDRAADLATKNPYANPRPVTRDGIRHLLQQAFDGQCPA